MNRSRLTALAAAGMLLLTCGGCGSHEPADAGLKTASSVTLPNSTQGWSTTNKPSSNSGQLNNKPVKVQVAFYYNDADKSQLRIVTITAGADKGDVTSIKNSLNSGKTIGRAQCGALPDAGQAITCVWEMSGGMMQATGTSGSMDDLAGFGNTLYNSLS